MDNKTKIKTKTKTNLQSQISPHPKPKPKSNHKYQQQPQQQQHHKKFVSTVTTTTSPQTQTQTNNQEINNNTPTPSGIPDEINYFSNTSSTTSSSSFKSSSFKSSSPSRSQSFGSSSEFNKLKNDTFNIPQHINFTSTKQPLFNNNNNNNNNINTEELSTIAKITKTTTIQFDGSKEKPTITIKQETTIQAAPEVKCWSPFIEGLRFAVKHNQGKRDHMENSASIIEPENAARNTSYSFSLFDGHLGDEAAKFCTEHLHKHVSENISENTQDSIEENIRRAFHQTDESFHNYATSNVCEAGAVGVYVLYNGYDNCIYVANIGDCKAILCSGGKLKPLTIDHNPKNEDEKKRCGKCINTNSDLLSGQISVTRAIGDYYKSNDMKKLDGLICDPYICKHKLDDKDEFLVIACDGLWDVLDDKFVMSVARQSLRSNGDVDLAAEKLINVAAKKSDHENPLTSDNISVMVIGFANKDKDGKLHIGPKREKIPRPPGGLRRRRFSSRKRANSQQ